jgi:hypothetical protein
MPTRKPKPKRDQIILLTRRTDMQNAVIRCVGKDNRPSDKLDEVKLFTREEDEKWIAGNQGWGWCPTIAPAGAETGVPALPR